MGSVRDVTIPTRFILTLGHFVVTLMALFHKSANIDASLGSSASQTDKDAADRELTGVLVVSVIMLAVSFVGLIGGFTMFNDKVNGFQIIMQFVGGIGMSWFIVSSWRYSLVWLFFVLCSLLPALVELAHIVGMYCLRRAQY